MNKKIILVIGFLILFAGGIFIWQYLRIAEEIVPAEKEVVVEKKNEAIVVKVPVILLDGALPLGFDYPEDKIREDFETGRRVGCGDSIAFIEKEIKHTPEPLTAVYQILLGEGGRTVDELIKGTKYINPIPKERIIEGVVRSSLRFERVVIKDNIAMVYLTGDYMSIGTCDPPRVEAVLRFAAKQFPWIEDVDIFINGGEAGVVLVHGGPGAGIIPWEWSYCIPEKPCNLGQGDCDADADCSPGLFCAQNVGARYGQRVIIDVCEVRK